MIKKTNWLHEYSLIELENMLDLIVLLWTHPCKIAQIGMIRKMVQTTALWILMEYWRHLSTNASELLKNGCLILKKKRFIIPMI